MTFRVGGAGVKDHTLRRRKSFLASETPSEAPPTNETLHFFVDDVTGVKVYVCVLHYVGSSDYAFHPRCGRNVTLTDKCTVARRVNSYKDGITFSVRPLKERQIFEVQHPLGRGGEGWVPSV